METEGKETNQIALIPLDALLGSLKAKLYTDPMGGDSRVSYESGPRPAIVDPLRKKSDIEVINELERRISLVPMSALSNIRGTITDICHDQPAIAGMYAETFVNMGFEIGRRIEKELGSHDSPAK